MSKYHAHLLRDGSNMSITGKTIESVRSQVENLKFQHDYSISKLSEDKKVWIKVYTMIYSKIKGGN